MEDKNQKKEFFVQHWRQNYVMAETDEEAIEIARVELDEELDKNERPFMATARISHEFKKEDWNYIFDGIEQDFEEFWLRRRNDHFEHEQQKYKKLKWETITKWIETYSKLMREMVPKNRIRCLIQTKQDYEDFTVEEIEHVLKTLGKLAHHLYSAERDVFESCYVLHRGFHPLQKYYQRALEEVMWCVATFTKNKGDGCCSFITLIGRSSQLRKRR